MKSLILGLAAAATLAAALPAAAQSVDQREHNQAVRIHEGVRSGALTPGEAARLHAREVRLHRVEARARYRHGGVLTPHARRVMARMEHRDSRAIYRLKHNGRVG
jgi:Ni/Co efflux regulator RcnB